MSELFLLTTSSALHVAGAQMLANSSLGGAFVVFRTPDCGFSTIEVLDADDSQLCPCASSPLLLFKVLPFQPFLLHPVSPRGIMSF